MVGSINNRQFQFNYNQPKVMFGANKTAQVKSNNAGSDQEDNKKKRNLLIGAGLFLTLAGITTAVVLKNKKPAEKALNQASKTISNGEGGGGGSGNIPEWKQFGDDDIFDNYLTFLSYGKKEDGLNAFNRSGGNKIDFINDNGAFRNHSAYSNLLLNTLEKPEEAKKLNKIALDLGNKYDEVSSAVNSKFGLNLEDKFPNVNKIDDNEHLSTDIKVFVLRDLMKKKHYSLNKTESNAGHYCLEDPLTSKKAREEIIDTHLGWDLLQNEYVKGSDERCRFLDKLNEDSNLFDKNLFDSFKFKDDEKEFIKNCNDKTMVCGSDSEVSSHELAKLGKMMREKLGITVD